MSLSGADEQRLSELQAAGQELEAQDIEYARAATSMGGTLQEAQAAAAALRAFEADGAGGGEEGPREVESLVPLGMGLHARARISYAPGVVVSVGAGAAVEKDVRAALNYVEARMKEIEVAVQDVSARRSHLSQQAQTVRQEMDAIIRRATGAPGAGAAGAAAPGPAEGRA